MNPSIKPQDTSAFPELLLSMKEQELKLVLKGLERVILIFFLKLCSLALFSELLVITSFSFGL